MWNRAIHASSRICFGLILLQLLSSCASTSRSPTWLDEETGQLVTRKPASDDKIVCRFEAATGSSIRQKVCHRVLTDDERRENYDHALNQLESIRDQEMRPRPPPTVPE